MTKLPKGYYYYNESGIGCVVQLLEDNSTEHTTALRLKMLSCDLPGQVGRLFEFYRLRGGWGTVGADKLCAFHPQPTSDLECANCLLSRLASPQPQIAEGDGHLWLRHGDACAGPFPQFEDVWHLLDAVARSVEVRGPIFDFDKFKSQYGQTEESARDQPST